MTHRRIPLKKAWLTSFYGEVTAWLHCYKAVLLSFRRLLWREVHCVPMLTFSHSSPASLMINQAFQPKSEDLNIHLCNFLEPCLHIKFSRSGLSSFRSGGIGKHKGNLSAWEPCRNSPATALDMESILSTGQWNILCFKLLHCTLDWNFWFWTSYIFLADS